MKKFSLFTLLILMLFLFSMSAQASLLLYGVRGNELVIIDHNNPANVNVVGSLGLAPGNSSFSLAYDPNNDVLAVLARNTSSNVFTLHTVNQVTAQATQVANLGDGDVVGFYEAFDFNDATGKFIVSRGVSSNVFLSSDHFSLDLAGNLTLLSTSTGTDNDNGAYDPVLDRFLTSDSNSHAGLLSINLSTGAATQLGAGVLGSGARDLAFNKDDGKLYAVNSGALRTIDTNNGNGPLTLNNLGTITGGISAIAFAQSPVPEPSALVLSMISLLAFVTFRKRLS